MSLLSKEAQVNDHLIKSRRLIVPFSITFNAVPASKVHATDLPEALVLSTEGKTAEAAAADSGCNFATAADATGIFGILLRNVGKVKKLLDAQCVNLSSGTIAVSRSGASSSGVTASQNIALSLDSSLSLAATSLSGHLVADYIIEKN